MYSAARRLSLFAATLALAACGSDSIGPPSNTSPVGSYHATRFVTTGSSGPINQLVAGATLTITLTAAGTTSGQLHLPAQGATAAHDEDMAGTWQRSGDKVQFVQAADTFMNDLTFSMQPASATSWDLVADQVVNGTRIQLTLAGQTGLDIQL